MLLVFGLNLNTICTSHKFSFKFRQIYAKISSKPFCLQSSIFLNIHSLIGRSTLHKIINVAEIFFVRSFTTIYDPRARTRNAKAKMNLTELISWSLISSATIAAHPQWKYKKIFRLTHLLMDDWKLWFIVCSLLSQNSFGLDGVKEHTPTTRFAYARTARPNTIGCDRETHKKPNDQEKQQQQQSPHTYNVPKIRTQHAEIVPMLGRKPRLGKTFTVQTFNWTRIFCVFPSRYFCNCFKFF